MKSLKDFTCGWKIPNVDIKKGENSQIFDEITIKASPPIYAIWNKLFNLKKKKSSIFTFSKQLFLGIFYFFDKLKTMNFVDSRLTYGRNQSGCEKAKNLGFLPFILWVFLTIYIWIALMKITMCFYCLEASHIMSWNSWY